MEYEIFRILIKEKEKPTEQDEVFRQALVDIRPDVLICGISYSACPTGLITPAAICIFLVTDKGHLLKNEDSEIVKAMNKISALSQIMLTGTLL